MGSVFGKTAKKIASYWRNGNTPLPEQRKYNTQCWYDPNIQNFIEGSSSELELENNKSLVSEGLQVLNQGNLNDEKMECLRRHILIQSIWCRLPHIYLLYLETIRVFRGKKIILILITWMVIPRFGLPIRHLLHMFSYCYNEQQVLWQV